MTVLDDTLAVIRADAVALEVAAHRGHITAMDEASPTVLVEEIAWSQHYAEGRGGVAAVAAQDYEDDRLAYCQRWRQALACSARLHKAGHLLPVLTRTDVTHLPAVRVERDWAVLDTDTWRRVVAEPQLLGDGEDEDGGRVELALEGRGPVSYRRGERLWARNPETHAAALEAADGLAAALLIEAMWEGTDGA